MVLIDGVFTQALSVWHKEILYALERGVAVYGLSSMGALRVAETAAFGAVGVGRIFDGYRSGELTDDDEVAVVHATAEWGYRSLSDAMVNIRASLGAARETGIIDDATHDRLVTLGRTASTPSAPSRNFSTTPPPRASLPRWSVRCASSCGTRRSTRSARTPSSC